MRLGESTQRLSIGKMKQGSNADSDRFGVSESETSDMSQAKNIRSMGATVVVWDQSCSRKIVVSDLRLLGHLRPVPRSLDFHWTKFWIVTEYNRHSSPSLLV